jgi:uncharacterized protein DUF4190/uncharacterized protein DUF4339
MYKIIGADGKEYGPVSIEGLRQWMAEGRANAQTKVLVEGTTEWKPLAEVAELAQTPPSQPAAGTSAAGSTGAPGVISAPEPTPRTNPLALTGVVLGVCSLTFCFCCYGLPLNVAGLICSLVALSQINNNPAREQGKGLATAGLVLSVLSLLLGLAMLLSFRGVGAGEWMRRIHRL